MRSGGKTLDSARTSLSLIRRLLLPTSNPSVFASRALRLSAWHRPTTLSLIGCDRVRTNLRTCLPEHEELFFDVCCHRQARTGPRRVLLSLGRVPSLRFCRLLC